MLDENRHILNFNQLKNLLTLVIIKKDPEKTVKEFTNNIPAVINQIDEVYSLISDRSLKNRLHRLTKKLKPDMSVSNVRQ